MTILQTQPNEQPQSYRQAERNIEEAGYYSSNPQYKNHNRHSSSSLFTPSNLKINPQPYHSKLLTDRQEARRLSPKITHIYPEPVKTDTFHIKKYHLDDSSMKQVLQYYDGEESGIKVMRANILEEDERRNGSRGRSIGSGNFDIPRRQLLASDVDRDLYYGEGNNWKLVKKSNKLVPQTKNTATKQSTNRNKSPHNDYSTGKKGASHTLSVTQKGHHNSQGIPIESASNRFANVNSPKNNRDVVDIDCNRDMMNMNDEYFPSDQRQKQRRNKRNSNYDGNESKEVAATKRANKRNIKSPHDGDDYSSGNQNGQKGQTQNGVEIELEIVAERFYQLQRENLEIQRKLDYLLQVEGSAQNKKDNRANVDMGMKLQFESRLKGIQKEMAILRKQMNKRQKKTSERQRSKQKEELKRKNNREIQRKAEQLAKQRYEQKMAIQRENVMKSDKNANVKENLLKGTLLLEQIDRKLDDLDLGVKNRGLSGNSDDGCNNRTLQQRQNEANGFMSGKFVNKRIQCNMGSNMEQDIKGGKGYNIYKEGFGAVDFQRTLKEVLIHKKTPFRFIDDSDTDSEFSEY